MITTLPHQQGFWVDEHDQTLCHRWEAVGCSRKDLARGRTTPIYVLRTYKVQSLTEEEKEMLRAEGFSIE